MNARRPAPSPCVSVCRMEPDTGLCTGCLRTIDEIAGWGAASDADRLAVWAAIGRRREARAADARPGGRRPGDGLDAGPASPRRSPPR